VKCKYYLLSLHELTQATTDWCYDMEQVMLAPQLYWTSIQFLFHIYKVLFKPWLF